MIEEDEQQICLFFVLTFVNINYQLNNLKTCLKVATNAIVSIGFFKSSVLRGPLDLF